MPQITLIPLSFCLPLESWSHSTHYGYTYHLYGAREWCCSYIQIYPSGLVGAINSRQHRSFKRHHMSYTLGDGGKWGFILVLFFFLFVFLWFCEKFKIDNDHWWSLIYTFGILFEINFRKHADLLFFKIVYEIFQQKMSSLNFFKNRCPTRFSAICHVETVKWVVW